MLNVEHLLMQIATESLIELLRIRKIRSCKVRETFDLGDTLLFLASDRISAFDVILPCAKR
jgi:phosphoribosylaminoimidazole-succinocarboxamide synthase